MSYFSRTISYMKRNGIRHTFFAVMERMNLAGADPDQVRANAYHKPEGSSLSEDSPEAADAKAKDLQKADFDSIRFSIVVPAYETKESYLREMIDSVVEQSYENWQLVIGDASVTDRVKNVVDTYHDDRICYLRLRENKGISDNTNAAIAAANGDFIGLLDHDDVLCRDALYEVRSLLMKENYIVVYTDEDKINEDGSVWFEPNYKPDFNFDFLLSNNYFCHFTVIRKDFMKKLPLRRDFDGAQDYDLFLRAVYEIEKERLEEKAEPDSEMLYPGDYMRSKIGHVPKVLYHWRAHMASTADNPESKRYAYEAGKRALEDFVSKNGWHAKVSHTRHLGFYDISYEPDIFAVRRDVTAVCGRVVQKGKVVKGPVVDGKMLFAGMNAAYSGYMHKASLKFEAEKADAACIRFREDAPEKSDDKKKNGDRNGRMVYLPEYIVRK